MVTNLQCWGSHCLPGDSHCLPGNNACQKIERATATEKQQHAQELFLTGHNILLQKI